MAGHDVTTEITALVDSGWTLEEIKATLSERLGYSYLCSSIVMETRTGFEVSGRQAQYAVQALRPRVETVAVEAAAPTMQTATNRQVDYLTSLIARRVRDGEGGGYASVDQYVTGGRIDVAALRRISREQASILIDSLRGQY